MNMLKILLEDRSVGTNIRVYEDRLAGTGK